MKTYAHVERLTYRCLVYAWGDTKDLRMITINGGVYEVTNSLHIALRRLRERGINGLLWIDALCIDQSNEAEKTTQVSLMGDTFSAAVMVLMWLGTPRTGFSDGGVLGADKVAFNAVPILHALAGGVHVHELPCFPSRSQRQQLGVCRDRDASEDWSRVFQSRRAWMSSSWFTRTWTIQEVTKARRAVFLFGSRQISWDIMASAWRHFAQHMQSCCSESVYRLAGTKSRTLSALAVPMIDLWNLKRSLKHEQDIVDVLIQCNAKAASDPPDKVFALLALQAGPGMVKMVPDYRMSLQDTFVAFARSLNATRGILVTLGLDLEQRVVHLSS
ncbi:hypothetical protein LTR85_001463 [Meristemomyces frigidus]|nr:hypothetical protein LTR85_001463 [Meristemomyces frigidus]